MGHCFWKMACVITTVINLSEGLQSLRGNTRVFLPNISAPFTIFKFLEPNIPKKIILEKVPKNVE